MSKGVESMEWKVPEVKGKITGRMHHQMEMIANKYLVVVFGMGAKREVCKDVFLLDMSVMEWKELKLNGTPPSPRFAHSLAVSDELEAVIFGGIQADGSLVDNSVYVLKESNTQAETKAPDESKEQNKSEPSADSTHDEKKTSKEFFKANQPEVSAPKVSQTEHKDLYKLGKIMSDSEKVKASAEESKIIDELHQNKNVVLRQEEKIASLEKGIRVLRESMYSLE